MTLSLANFAGGAVRPSTAITVPAQGQIAQFLNQAPGWEIIETSFQGTLSVSATGPIAATGLRARYNERREFLVTATPALGSVDRPVFPHIVDSGGFATQVVLVDPLGLRPSAGVLSLWTQSGQPLNLSLR